MNTEPKLKYVLFILISLLLLHSSPVISQPIQLTFGDASSINPKWSPDGNWVGYADNTNRYLMIVNPYTQQRKHIVSNAWNCDQEDTYSWSNDGTYLAYNKEGYNGFTAIWISNILNTDSTCVVQFGPGPYGARPFWSPDDQWLGYCYCGTLGCTIYKLRPFPGSTPQPLFQPWGFYYPKWSKAEKIFYSAPGGPEIDIWDYDIGADTLFKYPDRSPIYDFCLSDKHLYYLTSSTSPYLFNLIELESSAHRYILPSPYVSHVNHIDLSPDDQYAVFTASTGMYLIDNNTGETTFLDNATANCDWSPDGKWIAYEKGVDGYFQIFLISTGMETPTLNNVQIDSVRADQYYYIKGERAYLRVYVTNHDSFVGNVIVSANVMSESINDYNFDLGDRLVTVSGNGTSVAFFSWDIPIDAIPLTYQVSAYTNNGAQTAYAASNVLLVCPEGDCEAEGEQARQKALECWDPSVACLVNVASLFPVLGVVPGTASALNNLCEVNKRELNNDHIGAFVSSTFGGLDAAFATADLLTDYAFLIGMPVSFALEVGPEAIEAYFECIDGLLYPLIEGSGGYSGIVNGISSFFSSVITGNSKQSSSMSEPREAMAVDTLTFGLLWGDGEVELRADTLVADKDSTTLRKSLVLAPTQHYATILIGSDDLLPLNEHTITIRADSDSVLSFCLFHLLPNGTRMEVSFESFTSPDSSIFTMLLSDTTSLYCLNADYDGDQIADAIIYPTSITYIGVECEKAPSTKGALLHQNYPNPFNPATIIEYYIPVKCSVRLEIFDIWGRPIARLVNSEQEEGTHSAAWRGMDDKGHYVTSGVYLYRLKAGAFTETKKLVLAR